MGFCLEASYEVILHKVKNCINFSMATILG